MATAPVAAGSHDDHVTALVAHHLARAAKDLRALVVRLLCDAAPFVVGPFRAYLTLGGRGRTWGL